MDNLKRQLVCFRNALGFSYTWLVICVLIVLFVKKQNVISTTFLLELLGLCAWGALCFAVCFANSFMQKKGFIFSLTIFFVLFVPVEILMFYLMGIFNGVGELSLWITFAMIIIISYISCLLIDFLIMKKRTKAYTDKLNSYKNSNERQSIQ